MTSLPTSPSLLMVGVLTLMAGGLAAIIWGKKLPRQGDWLVGLGLLTLFILTGLNWGVLSDEAFTPQTWLRGWIWPKEETGAITVGVLRDSLGLTLTTLTALVAASLLLGPGTQARTQRADRFYASLSFSTAGVALSWFALTPWLALTGLAITTFGGFLALGSQWAVEKEATLASRFGWERSWGLLLALLGLCVLAGGRAPLSLINASGVGSWSAQSGNPLSDLLGAGLLFVGALIQLQPFPFLGWVMSESDTPGPARIVLAQVFPAWSILALLIRLEPQLREVGVFPIWGWIGLVSALLTAAAGLFRHQWQSSLSAWTSAGFSLAVAVLAFAGPGPALCVAVGVGLGASALAGFSAALEEGGTDSSNHHLRGMWAKVGCGLAAASGTGFVGFLAAGGGLRWLTIVGTQPALLAASAFVFFLFAFLGWKSAWMAITCKGSTQAPWSAVLAPYLLVMLSLGVVWTGTASGSIIPGNPDRLFQSLLSLLFGAPGEAWGDEAGFVTASGLYWGASVLAIVLAYWTVGKKPEVWPSVSRSIPRISSFLASGYGVDVLFRRLLGILSAVGTWSVWLVDSKAWQGWVPMALATGLQRSASAIASADAKLSWQLGGVLRRPVEAGAKLLQLIQNGDVQWYLFFAVGSGIAILAHFMRT
jgi:hypothetical protein